MRRGFRYKQLKYIKTVTKPNGKTFTYYSEPGKKRTRLPDPNHPEFLKAYVAASEGAERIEIGKQAKKGTIAALMALYFKSDVYLSNKDSTKAFQRRILNNIATTKHLKATKTIGEGVAADLTPKHIKVDLSHFNPHPANNRLKCWRSFCKWAENDGHIEIDPARSVRARQVPKTSGHTPWTIENIETYRDYWPIGTMERLSMELLYWTAARSVDAVRLSEGMIDRNGWLNFTQVKTGGDVSIPWARALPEWAAKSDLTLLHKCLEARKDRHMTFITTMYGASRSHKSFSQWFSASATKAELPQLSAHGLRKSRAILLAESGATAKQGCAWTGHETLEEMERYIREADKKKLLSKGSALAQIGNQSETVSNLSKK